MVCFRVFWWLGGWAWLGLDDARIWGMGGREGRAFGG